MLDVAGYRAALATAAEIVIDAGRTGPLSAAVPGCPGWDLTRLLGHLGGVHRWAAAACAGARLERTPRPDPEADVCAWYVEGLRELQHVFDGLPAEQPCWNFTGRDQTAMFWFRRQAHEVAVHAVDADQARGRTPRMAPELAADGIDEALRVFAVRRPGGIPERPLVLRCTDTGDAWTLTGRDDALSIAPGADPEAPAWVAGPALAVELALYGRGDLTQVSLDPDGSTARAFLASGRTA